VAEDPLSEEVGIDGWNDDNGSYTFRYADAQAARPPLLVKDLVLGDRVLLNWVALTPAAATAEPSSLELDISRYTTEAAGRCRFVSVRRLPVVKSSPAVPASTEMRILSMAAK
jgi:PI31 proteasome regulator N-terminal